jgi:hypothetical protein
MSEKLFDTIQDLAKSGFVFRIQDSGPDTLDRITVMFCDGDYLALSHNGLGFSQWGEGLDPQVMAEHAEAGNAVDLALGDLQPELQNHILYRVNEAWEDTLSAANRLDPKIVAPNRESAEINDGTIQSSGKGIYIEDGEFFVRLDGPEGDDRGCYDTARKALLNTLPDNYSVSGPEYHPLHDVASLEPTPGVSERLEALVAREATEEQ